VTFQLIHGDARHVSDHVAPESVDLIVTSPPYFALRSYRDDGEHYDGQIGSEPTPTDFLDALVACTADWLTVLKPGGSLWVNLGDKYAGSNGQSGGASHLSGGATYAPDGTRSKDAKKGGYVPESSIPAKSLMGLPWRYALRCIDELGLILRAEVIWSKPNGLPESVTDRVRRSHEQWFHFTRQGRYFAAVDEVREEYAPASLASYAKGGLAASVGDASHPSRANGNRQRNDGNEAAWTGNPLGKLPGSVWTVPTEPLTVPDHLGVDHFAAFPSEWPRRIILGWSPSGICTACGEPRRPVVDRTIHLLTGSGGKSITGGIGARSSMVDHRKASEATITSYACACPTTDAPTTPAVVLDPFCGTGTTVAVAHHLGRHGIGVDLSRDYLRLAEWRCTDDTRLHDKVQTRTGITRPADPDIDGQLDLFGGDAA